MQSKNKVFNELYYDANLDLFKCKCGKTFNSSSSLISHARYCDLYESVKLKRSKCSKYKIDDNLYQCECGRQFTYFQSLNAHFSHCEFHAKQNNKKLKKRSHEINKEMSGWSKFNENDKNEFRIRSTNTHKEKIKNGEIIPAWCGRHHSKESKEKTRNSTIKYLKKYHNFQGPRYNVAACNFIDNLNIKNNWNLKHALNGGEFQICGYYVDGYDEKLNIVFEYDEPIHYIDYENNILREKDINRQNLIIKKLNCKFYRYNEKLNYFYEIKN